ncbi:unnamed protein product [Paramecium sonneborni]|uniref:Uncharacterized protein n=1 Tax=Paramecium sonneborni TaxID=65129 RepID=A0A8S1KK27_9CILI|nr:unnamed protein product [Paramecium sonneborni]
MSTAKSYIAQQKAKKTEFVYFYLKNSILKKNLFIVDGFLDKKSQAVVFFEHYQKPRFVIYFQSSKDEVEQNMGLLGAEEQKNVVFKNLPISFKIAMEYQILKKFLILCNQMLILFKKDYQIIFKNLLIQLFRLQ